MNLRTQTAVFAEVATGVTAGVEAERRVPTCPEWQLRDLVGHLGQAPRWAAGIIRSGTATPPPDPRDADPGPPSAWTDWLLAGADELLDAVATVDTPVWTLVGPQPVDWWVRRLLADLVVHTVDAALTAGVPYQVPDDLAVSTIADGLELLATPLVTFSGHQAGTVALHASTGHGWLITRTDAGTTWKHGTGPADVTLSGSTQDLLLVLTRRQPLDQVTVDGDRVLVEELLTYTV